MSDQKPDFIVAIDFGMTCTGVAYANPSIGSESIRWIQRWPGRMQANENKVIPKFWQRIGDISEVSGKPYQTYRWLILHSKKVPTILVYPTDQSVSAPSSWGFLSETVTEQTAENKEHREWFKTYLDDDRRRQCQAEARDPSDVPGSIEMVERWYCDYFRHLYKHIESRLQMELSLRWEDAKIEFIFSVPTTWKPHPTVERFRKITERAGFGKFPNHRSSIGLTEAEAAAVFMSCESPAIFKEREILLVCDIGGGTTDLSVLRVSGVGKGSLNLEQLDVVFGANLGAAQIDGDFENLVLERLEKANKLRSIPMELEEISWQMMKSKEYQNAKCDYGSPDDTETFSVSIPELSKDYSVESLGILNGEMRFKRDELQTLFDKQIVVLFDLIDTQLSRITQKIPNDQVMHLVLSGGLGNSAYLQKRLRERYAFGASSFSNTVNLQVRIAPDPQLVVCKGIVADRLERLRTGKSILGWRCCRASYGTICKVLYNPNNPAHFYQHTQRDPADGKIYIPNVVNWFIKQGDPVSVDNPIMRPFTQKIDFGNPSRLFRTSVVVSQLDKDLLPFTLDQNCKVLCEVMSDFSGVNLACFKLKNRHFWNLGAKYYRVEYCIKVALGPADITFELWFRGQKLSRDNPIRVEWTASDQPNASLSKSNTLRLQESLPVAPPQKWDLHSGVTVTTRNLIT